MVYRVVSVDPMMVDAIVPIRLSTPKFFIISIATAVEALPEIGRISINGNTSEGILKIDRTGESIFSNNSSIPEVLRALIARNKPTSVGNILITVSIPSLEPN